MQGRRQAALAYITACQLLNFGFLCRRYSHLKRLCLQGTSAGAWIVGALLNERPSLFCAAVLTAPSLDVLASMLDSGHARSELGDVTNEQVKK